VTSPLPFDDVQDLTKDCPREAEARNETTGHDLVTIIDARRTEERRHDAARCNE
jgi:hypothetical protein